MKKNDWLIITATLAYSYLFYNQSAGINFLLFTLLLFLLLLLQNPRSFFSAAWMAAGTGSIVSAFFVFKWGTPLPVLANICSLLALAGFSIAPHSSLLVAAINTCYSFIAAIPLSLFRAADISNPSDVKRRGIFRKISLILIPGIITMVFYYLYKASNPIFEKFADKINFDFISVEWIVFTSGGFVLMFGFFHHVILKSLARADANALDRLSPLSLEQHVQSGFGKWITVSNEFSTGVILFSLLNMLLLCVNSLDIFYMWIQGSLPAGITWAQYLHDGTNTLIISIIMAIAVILFVFRGYLNFIEKNKALKLLCYAWIAQNVMLVITTASRNWWTIESSGLTRRRIGVYVYLLLCLTGLVTTFIKVARQKNNWFLFRKNSWAFYAVFIFACFFNWDGIIVNYNCKNFKALEFDYIDRNYQAELSHTCLAPLFEYYKAEKKELAPHNIIFTKEVIKSMYATYHQLKAEEEQADWQSLCLSKKENLKAVDRMIQQKEVEAYPVSAGDTSVVAQ